MLEKGMTIAGRHVALSGRAGYPFLLLALLALLILYPLLAEVAVVQTLLDVLIYITLFFGVLVAASNSFQLGVAAILALFMLVCNNLADAFPQNWLIATAVLSGMGFFGFIASIILRDILIRSRRVTAELIYGALSVYLLIGVAFAFGYMLIDFIDPAAFDGEKFLSGTTTQELEGFLYFSFVTMTTLGFGDITPNTPQSGAFVYMEAIVGQMYMAVLVARLVGLHISHQESEER